MGHIAHGFSEVEPVSHNIIYGTKTFANTPSGLFMTTLQSNEEQTCNIHCNFALFRHT